VVFGQGLAIIIWPSESGDQESGNQALLSGINEFFNVVKSQAESLSAPSRMEQKVL
jgi:hypothetical protein